MPSALDVGATDMNNICDEFSASTAYSKGDYVFYDGVLYRFTVNHAAGAWIGTDAAAAKLAQDVDAVKSTVDNLNAVAYWGDYGEQTLNPGSTAATYVGFVRKNSRVTCNGTASATGGDLRVKLNSNMQRTQGTGTIDGWAGMDFKAGHTYAVKMQLLSGTVTPSGSDPEPSLSI